MAMASAPDEDFGIRPLVRSLPMVLLRARETSMQLFRPMLSDYDLTEQQWRVLRVLAARQKPLDVGRLAAATFLLAPSLSRILVNLEARQLVERQTAPEDQRRSLIELSEAGGELVNLVAPRSEAIYRRVEERFGADRLQALLVELHELADLDPSLPDTNGSNSNTATNGNSNTSAESKET